MKCKDVPAGMVFKYVDSEGDGLMQQTQFIKLNGKQNVVNVATWTAALVDPDAPVVILGVLELKKKRKRR